MKFTLSYAAYPISEGWTLSLAFVPVTVAGPRITSSGFTITAGTAEWTVTIPASVTATFETGTYNVTTFVTLAGERYSAEYGQVAVAADPATAVEDELLSFAARMLPIVRAEIRARLTGTGSAHQQYTIGDRAVSKIPLKELHELEAVYANRVAQAKQAGSFGTPIYEIHRRTQVPCGSDWPRPAA